MKRSDFIKTIAGLPLLTGVLSFQELNKVSRDLPASPLMPVFFFGHGSPMNAIEENYFSKSWQNIGRNLPKPAAIICVSAHWLTKGSFLTVEAQPKTIHDFGGFPKALFDVEYPAPGQPQLAKEVQGLLTEHTVGLTDQWGLDHGCWSVVKHLYPESDVPVIQLSIDYDRSPEYHYNFTKQLSSLRRKGVLIIGSGNLVHNLRMVAWNKVHEESYGFDWAVEANELLKNFISENNTHALFNYETQGSAIRLAIPTPDHYYPMLYVLGLQEKGEHIHYFNDKPVMGSLTMTSFRISTD